MSFAPDKTLNTQQRELYINNNNHSRGSVVWTNNQETCSKGIELLIVVEGSYHLNELHSHGHEGCWPHQWWEEVQAQDDGDQTHGRFGTEELVPLLQGQHHSQLQQQCLKQQQQQKLDISPRILSSVACCWHQTLIMPDCKSSCIKPCSDLQWEEDLCEFLQLSCSRTHQKVGKP